MNAFLLLKASAMPDKIGRIKTNSKKYAELKMVISAVLINSNPKKRTLLSTYPS